MWVGEGVIYNMKRMLVNRFCNKEILVGMGVIYVCRESLLIEIVRMMCGWDRE
jgi:ribosomal protein L24E